MTVPYTFGNATTSIPLSNLDADFATPITLGNTNVYLGNTTTNINNLSLGNVSITSVGSTFPNSYLSNSSATLGNAVVTLGGTTTSVGNLTLTNVTISSVASTLPNSYLANSSVTINGTSVALGGSATITANAAATLTISTGLSGTSYNGGTAVTIAIDSTVATLTGVQTLTNKTINGSNNTLSNIPNSALTNNTVTVNGTSIALGASGTVTAAAGTLTGTTLNSTVVTSSLTSVGTITTGVWNGTAIGNTYLANSTISGVSLGSNLANLTAGTNISFSSGTTYNGSSAITINATASPQVYPGAGIANSTGTAWGTSYSTTGSGTVVALATSPTFVTPILGTPTSGTLTNTTGFPAANLAGTALPSAIVTSSLTAVGTIATGVWNGSIITGTYGGTGVNNGSNTITIAGNLTHAGAFTQSFTATANTAVTLPAGATASSNNLLSSATAVGIVTGTPSSTTYLRGDGTWATVSASGSSISNGTSNVTVNSSGGTVTIATAGTTALTVDTNQNVGIGVTPSAWKSNYKVSQVGNAASIVGRTDINNSYFSSNWYVNSSNQDIYPNTGFATLYSQGSGTHTWYTAASGTAGNAITFTQVMTLDASGNLGVGTTSPAALLDVWGSGKSILVGGTASNNITAQLSTALYLSGAYDASNKRSYRMYVDGNGALNFDATGSYAYANLPSSGTYANKMTLDTSGNLLIGYTSSNGAYKLQVNSQIFATSAIIATSDARYKTNVTPISNGLSLVNKLNPVSFDWKEHSVHNFDTKNTNVGFLAQDVQEVLKNEIYLNSVIRKNETELPDGTKEEFLGLSDSSLIPILVKAIQELTTRLTVLENK